MALFKIFRGKKANLPTSYNDGYCYFTTDDGKFYIDTTNDSSGRILMNAGKADSLTIADTGSTEQAVYFSEGVPKVCTNLKGIPSGGTVGQYLIKNSGTNFDVSWSSLDLSPYLTVADASGIYLSKASASISSNRIAIF